MLTCPAKFFTTCSKYGLIFKQKNMHQDHVYLMRKDKTVV